MSTDLRIRSANTGISRREFLSRAGGGFGAAALAVILLEDEACGKPVVEGLHHPARARRVVQLFMAGGASHVDLFDYKPELERHHGEPSDFGEPVEAFQNGLGPWLKSPFPFHRYGQCGKWLSEPVAALGSVVDEIAFIHNMVGKTGVHSSATYLQTTGFVTPGFPGAGCWVSYALGSMNENLPAFVVLPDHRGYASNGPKNWDAAFLPARHQGTALFPNREEPIEDLLPPGGSFVTPESDAAGRELLRWWNERHRRDRQADSRLEARIRSYELAARMQLAAPEALDISREPDYIRRMYGVDRLGATFPDEINPEEEAAYFGLKCLVARRLLERGVRFVQVWSGNDNGFPRRNWDSHEDIQRDHGPLAWGMARGAAALILDLKQRGLLDDTLVIWTTEFGRMPSSQGSKGRDHNPYCFTTWLCGGGVRGGISYGPSDQWGFKPLDRDHPTEVHDIHATMLHLLGIDHTRLTVRHGGIDRRLTDVHGRVLHEILS
ncbi:MAG: hypothetical protein KatS3mg110_0284 [Pirellulaceae bacterium]|nr:MAG: hypothetical protein KatS3mg110_0284 [Pirellulaceae bacterium]